MTRRPSHAFTPLFGTGIALLANGLNLNKIRIARDHVIAWAQIVDPLLTIARSDECTGGKARDVLIC
jgi:hypothetical protein